MFYIKPPAGQISLHTLEECVFARLKYLNLLSAGKTHEFNGHFEYLIENTLYDRAGHFTLRLLASISEDLYNHWITKETLLFHARLNLIKPRQLHRLFKIILRHLKLLINNERLINQTLNNVCRLFLKPWVFKHLISENHASNCTFFKIKGKNLNPAPCMTTDNIARSFTKFICALQVRHEVVPDLVKKRELILTAGYVIVYCSKWKSLLVSLFCTYVNKDITRMKREAQNVINQDTRIDYLYETVYNEIFQENPTHGRITIGNIDNEVKIFPPCMQHLHMKLRSTHRLSHYARLYYSLFLKDGGMHIEDAISYWKAEYSKSHSCSSTCTHDWQSSEQKFIYSIRHMYGLEGSRKNYKSPSCEVICKSVAGPLHEGGCPFKDFDRNSLKTFLCASLSDTDVAKLLSCVTSVSPQIACAEFSKILLSSIDNILISSPLQYYLTMLNQTQKHKTQTDC